MSKERRAARSFDPKRSNHWTRHLPGKGITMTIATSTTINLSIDRFDIGTWLSDLLLPSDEAQDVQTTESVIRAVSSWNAGEIADAIGSVIGAVCIDDYGDADNWAARLFAESKVISSAIGLRRRSRLYIQRNLDRRGRALMGLEEAVRIAEGILTRRAMYSAQLDRFHDDIEDDLLFRHIVADVELELAEAADTDYAGVTSSSMDRREKTRQNEIDLDKLNGRFRAGRSGKRNSGVNRCDKVKSRARNAFFRSASMRHEFSLI